MNIKHINKERRQITAASRDVPFTLYSDKN